MHKIEMSIVCALAAIFTLLIPIVLIRIFQVTVDIPPFLCVAGGFAILSYLIRAGDDSRNTET